MNIFYLHPGPIKAAQYQYNKHVVKMILESAQLLCTAHIELDGDQATVPYKATHRNHPSAVWVRESSLHYIWLYHHMMGLGEEYTKRYGKIHKTITKCKDVLKELPINIENNGFNEPPQCMPDEYKRSNAIHGYWNYYIHGKKNIVGKAENSYSVIPKSVTIGY
jgi:hypothetical protein